MDEVPEKYRKDLAIVRDTVTQINKDISSANFEVVLSGNESTAFSELKEQLRPFILKLLTGDPQVFQSLLYRIDINEKDYRKVLTSAGSADSSELISELIIRREFQKVLTRRYFSGK